MSATLHGWLERNGTEDQAHYVRSKVTEDRGSASFEGLTATARRQMKSIARILSDEGYGVEIHGRPGERRTLLAVTSSDYIAPQYDELKQYAAMTFRWES